MDNYLQCLYYYVLENLSPAMHPDFPEYRRCADTANNAWIALKETLSPAQLELVENYRSAWDRVSALEDELLFQKAVALGKWMAR